MTSNSLARRVPVLSHSHAEEWIPAAALKPELKSLAQDVLPVLQGTKRLIIGLAALAMDEPSRARVPIVARQLSSFANRCLRDIDEMHDTPIEGVVARPIVGALRQLEVWAQAVTILGLSAEAASGLRAAYRNLRSSCQVLWRSELIPEGRAMASGVGHD